MSDFAATFARARELQAAGRLVEAERAYRELAASDEHREAVLEALADMYLQSGHTAQAIDTLVLLTEEVPDRQYYYDLLASTLDQMGQTGAAINHYQRLLARRPDLADAHYNLALLYKNEKRFAEAVFEYEEAIRLDIDQVEEAYSNLGVLYSEMRDATLARSMYEKALGANGEYIPALFNLAALFEETGERQPAIEIYRQILAIEPEHWDSLCRLAYAQKTTSADYEIIGSLRRAIENLSNDDASHEGLHFALGKVLDDVESFDDAFAAYKVANELGKRRGLPYDRAAAEQVFGELTKLFDKEWLEKTETSCPSAPIFVCGMFRSGSTLVEQILAAHPSIRAGGELDFLPWLAARRLAPYPQRLESISADELRQVADEYLAQVRMIFPDEENVTDKRPDNFLHVGLIRAMFPAARIVVTKRELRDNCLSIYFQQLGGNLRYATDLANIAHYYRQQERLMAHWQAVLGENVFSVDYDELVRNPEPILRKLIEFLGLPWDERCLDFQRSESLVKTASVWQVREPLHKRSSGRWQNYASSIAGIEALQPDIG